MGIPTILGFLIGRRQSILDITASKHAIWLGLLFRFRFPIAIFRF
jgi:hypothetical protein